MRWRPEVTLTSKDTPKLCMPGKQMPLDPKDVYLAKALLCGECDIELLKVMIMKAEGIKEIAAAFGLAQFILNYGDFIAPDTDSYVITG